MRIGLGTSTTLSATINPDFGQVELDPAVLNLSVFETFFPEKRPFFLEDSRVFVLPYNQLPMFHSRRIGATPGRLELGDDDETRQQARPDDDSRRGEGHRQGIRLDVRRARPPDRTRIRHRRNDGARTPTATRPSRAAAA